LAGKKAVIQFGNLRSSKQRTIGTQVLSNEKKINKLNSAREQFITSRTTWHSTKIERNTKHPGNFD